MPGTAPDTGHVQSFLMSILAMVKLLTLALDTACGLVEFYWQLARRRFAMRKYFSRHLGIIANSPVFPS